jgi:hypothetical protein
MKPPYPPKQRIKNMTVASIFFDNFLKVKLAALPRASIRANLRIAPQEAIKSLRNKSWMPRNARTGSNEDSCKLNRSTGTQRTKGACEHVLKPLRSGDGRTPFLFERTRNILQRRSIFNRRNEPGCRDDGVVDRYVNALPAGR